MKIITIIISDINDCYVFLSKKLLKVDNCFRSKVLRKLYLKKVLTLQKNVSK